jgi:hypothetical protein
MSKTQVQRRIYLRKKAKFINFYIGNFEKKKLKKTRHFIN